VARDSGAAISARRGGIVDQVDATRIVVRATGEVEAGKSGVDIYTLMKFQRSNQNTCINQRPLVKVGDVVNAGDVIADGPSTEMGELALGRNVLVAFMPWNGYNFEDSILISERIVKDDVFTSIHIEEFEVMARDTKLGPEDITRDIPTSARKRFATSTRRASSTSAPSGAGRHPGRQDHAEGRKPDDSGGEAASRHLRRKGQRCPRHLARLPPGVSGTVVEVRVFNRHGIDIDDRTRAIQAEEKDRLRKDADDERTILKRATYSRLREMLVGQVATAAPKGVKKGRAIDLETLESVERHEWWKFAVKDDKVAADLEAVKAQYDEAEAVIRRRLETGSRSSSAATSCPPAC
jgi:DNA-directed RNA polymerase subunit beta